MNRRSIVLALLFTLTLTGGMFLGRATAAQPAMQLALEALRNARGHLQNATHDKGGHRERALQLVNDAIAEVEAGKAYDRHH